MKICKNEEGSVGEKLARFLLGYRTTPHTATGCTPAEILMGRRLRTRLDMLHPCLSAKMERKSKHLPQPSLCNFEIRDLVMVKDPWIRGVIQMRLSPITYRVQVGDLFWKQHVDQLRSLAGSRFADVISPLPDVMSPPPVRPIPSVAEEVGVTKSSTEGQPSEPSSTLPITQETNHHLQPHNYHQR